jgi:hypothetical protein
VIGGFGANLWGIRAAELQYPRCYSSHKYCSCGEGVGSRGTPAAGLCPRPVREKGFPSNLLLD